MALIVFPTLVYFIGTSSWFLKSYVLPRLGRAIQAEIRTEDLTLNSSSLEAKGLVIVAPGAEPALTCASLRLKFHLLKLLRGIIALEDVVIDGLNVQQIQSPKGTSNLDPILEVILAPDKNSKRDEETIVNLEVRGIEVRNAQWTSTRNHPTQGPRTIQIQHWNLSVTNLFTGSLASVASQAEVRGSTQSDGSWDGTVSLDARVNLGLNGIPSVLDLTQRMQVRNGSGSFKPIEGLSQSGRVALQNGNILPGGLTFEQSGTSVGSLDWQGKFDSKTLDTTLQLDLKSIELERVLLLSTGSAGSSQNGGRLSGKTEVHISNKGSQLRSHTQLRAHALTLRQSGKTAPPLDLDFQLDLASDLDRRTMQISGMNLVGKQQAREFLTGKQSGPWTIQWGANGTTAPDAVMDLVLSPMEATVWEAFLPEAFSAGQLQGTIQLQSKSNGSQIGMAARIDWQGLSLETGNGMRPIQRIRLSLDGSFSPTQGIDVSQLTLQLGQQDREFLRTDHSFGYRWPGDHFEWKSLTTLQSDAQPQAKSKTDLRIAMGARGIFDEHKTLQLEEFRVELPPTSLVPTNELRAMGNLRLADPSAVGGSIAVRSEGFDGTPVYNLFNPQGKASSPSATESTTASKSNPFPQKEPEPLRWPMDVLDCDVQIRQAWLKEIHIQDLQLATHITASAIRLDPCRVQLNGGSFTGKGMYEGSNSVPRYQMEWKLMKLPIAPYARTLAPTLNALAEGQLFSSGSVSGVGWTGSNIKESLRAQLVLGLANGQIKLLPQNPKPSGGFLSAQSLASMLKLPELSQSTLTNFQVQIQSSNGGLDIDNTSFKADTLQADLSGRLKWSDNLADSELSIPVKLALERGIAEKANLVSQTTSQEDGYATLPPFLTVVGTLSKIDTRTDPAQVLKLSTRAAAGLLGNTAGNIVGGAGKALNSLGNFLTGKKDSTSTSTNTSAQSVETNSPSASPTKKSVLPNPLQWFKKKT